MKILSALLVGASLFASVPSFALVIEVARCSTADGKYLISVIDNLGIGPVRTPNYHAVVRDANNREIAGTYPVLKRRDLSISFGRVHYLDKQTSGRHFDLAGPSTNFHNYILKTELQNGFYRGTFIDDKAVHCSMFH